MRTFVLAPLKLVVLGVVSSLIGVSAQAHELRPAVADAAVGEAAISLTITLNAEAMLAGVDQAESTDTNDTPEAEAYDALRALSDAELTAQFEDAWQRLGTGFAVKVGEAAIPLELSGVEVMAEPDPELPRDTVIIATGALPAGETGVVVGWSPAYGPLVVRQVGAGEGAYQGFLSPGDVTPALPRSGILQEGAWDVFQRYVVVGFEHIVPKGLDHILFVLGLFFFALRSGPLLWQITAFTAAHTVTLALASLGYITISAAIVEPLIAASIVYVAIENVLRPKLGWWRTALVFGFGLLHGLGFASVLGEVGIEPARFILGLIAFNVGVEIGQLTVIAVAFGVLWLALQAARMAELEPDEEYVREMPVIYRGVALYGSLLIAAVGVYWVIERTLL